MISRYLAGTLLLIGTAMPAAERFTLPAGARLAIIGDSITEQKLYSKFIETYLMACAGRDDVECFQFGWSGEMAVGFAARMEIDLSLFEPTAATLCYGMNDGMYAPYNPTIGANYEAALRKVLDKLKAMGVEQVAVGSPSAVDSHFFQRFPAADYNANLAQLGQIGRKLATERQHAFADVHATMMKAMGPAKKALGETFQVAGYDGIHPDPNGHLLMALAFLKALGMEGDIGTIEVDLQAKATATQGHAVLSADHGKVELESARWPFCFDADPASPTSTRSLLPYCRFNEELNRLTLKVTGLTSGKARVTWGVEAHQFSREQLEQGINLAAEFVETPFQNAFSDLMLMVAEKQKYETHAMWNIVYPFRSKPGDLTTPEAKKTLAGLKAEVKAERSKLLQAMRSTRKPVTHTLSIELLP